MKESDDQRPICGPTGRTLGVRAEGPKIDIPVDEQGKVHPNTEGMSVTPGSSAKLPLHRRPKYHGGDGKDPVFFIELELIDEQLKFVLDSKDPETHGFVEPRETMTIDVYQSTLCSTKPAWTKEIPNV